MVQEFGRGAQQGVIVQRTARQSQAVDDPRQQSGAQMLSAGFSRHHCQVSRRGVAHGSGGVCETSRHIQHFTGLKDSVQQRRSRILLADRRPVTVGRTRVHLPVLGTAELDRQQVSVVPVDRPPAAGTTQEEECLDEAGRAALRRPW